MTSFKNNGPRLYFPGVLKALAEQQIPHRIIAARSSEDKDLTDWTKAAFPWGFSQIDWARVSSHRCVEYTSLDDLVPAFREMASTLDLANLVIVMWANADSPYLEMQLGDVMTIAREVFEEHETSTDVLVFNRDEGWLIEMHHEGTLCLGRANTGR